MQTTMRVTKETRDAVAQIARRELGGVSMDEALRMLIFEHQSRVALSRLGSDPEASADYLAEASRLAEVDTQVRE
jgi:hypothetical protein